jgi:hypothetical protein
MALRPLAQALGFYGGIVVEACAERIARSERRIDGSGT